MSPRYDKTSTLSTYKVDKELIEKIENYYSTRIPEVLTIKKPIVNQIEVIIKTTNESTTYKTINEYTKYNNGVFQDNVISIAIQLSYNNNHYGVVICTQFGRNDKNSYLRICLYDERPIEIIRGIEKTIITNMKGKKTINRIFYPKEPVLYPMLVIGIFIGIFGYFSDIKEVRTICIIILALDILYLAVFRFLKGYSSFNTKKQKSIDNFLKWFFVGIAGFILSSTLTPLRKIIFGF